MWKVQTRKSNDRMKEFIIEKLTELLIKQDFIDKAKGKDTYVKKTRAYRDLIKLVKEVDYEEVKN